MKDGTGHLPVGCPGRLSVLSSAKNKLVNYYMATFQYTVYCPSALWIVDLTMNNPAVLNGSKHEPAEIIFLRGSDM